MLRTTVAGLTGLLLAASAWAANPIDESTLGDFSNDHLKPTVITLKPGDNVISAATTWTGREEFDRDFWSFTLPAGWTLDAIMLEKYSGPDGGGSWFAVAQGGLIPGINDPDLLMAGLLVGKAAAAPPVDALALMGKIDLLWAGKEITAPLPGGTYTFWYQERGGLVGTEYVMNFKVTAPVPEPAAAGLFAVGLLGLLGLRARRRAR